jgi:integrase
MGIAIKFYLNTDNRYNQKEKAIYCYIREKGDTLVLHTGARIEAKHFDAKAQKIKRSFVGSPELNNYLEKYKLHINKIIWEYKADNPFCDFADLKKHIRNVVKNKSEYDFFDVFDKFIEIKTASDSKNTIKKYISLRNHLTAFQAANNIELSFANIDIPFFDSLYSYLVSKDMGDNTIRLYMQLLKTFLRFAIERDYTKNDKFEKYKNPKHTPLTHIALTSDDLARIINCHLDSSLERVRDVFLFMVYTGQRHGDIERFDISGVKESIWYIRQKKSSKPVQIPLIPQAMAILNKYNGKLPVINLRKLEIGLKEIGEKAGIDELVPVEKQTGKEITRKYMPKYTQITTHTARRTFNTVMSYKNVDSNVIKSVTGWESNKMANLYFKQNPVESRNAIEKAFMN